MKKSPLFWYFILTFAFTYGASFFAISDWLPSGPKSLLIFISLFGPTVAALIVAHSLGGWIEIKQLLKKVLIWRVGFRWYLFVFLFPVIARLLAVGVDVLLGGKAPQFFSSQAVNVSGISPLISLMALFVINFIRPSLVEEIGWRGFALPRLQERFGPVGESLILGLLWGLWHFHPINLPSYQGVMPWFVLSTICASVIFTWLYNHTNGSILIATLFHASNNVSEFVVSVAPINTGTGATIAYVSLRIIYLLFAILLVISFRKTRSA